MSGSLGSSYETGPFLAMAVFCEKVLREADGVLSAIRIVDRLQINVAGGPPPAGQLPPIFAALQLFVSLKPGSARGKVDFRIRRERPDGQIADLLGMPLLLEGEDRAANVVVNLSMQFEMEGLYWFYVLVDGVQFTRMPLRVIVMYQQAGGPPVSQ